MKFIINILPNESLDTHNLTTFVNNITSQTYKSELEIVIKEDGQLNAGLFGFIKENNLPVTILRSNADVKLAKNASTYWLNLFVNDALLPNAIMQWENTLTQHPTDLLELVSVDNSSPITTQLNTTLENIGEVDLNTIKHIFDIDANTALVDLPLKEKLNVLLGLQSYYVNDHNYRYRTFFNRAELNGRNVLYRVSEAKLTNDKPYLAKLLFDLIENDDYLRLNMPTLVLNTDSNKNQIKLGLQLLSNQSLIFDDKIKGYYSQALANRLAEIYTAVMFMKITTKQKTALLADLTAAVQKQPTDLKHQIRIKASKNGILTSLKKLF